MRKTKTLILVFSALCLFFFLAASSARRIYVLPIIMYHSVTPQAGNNAFLAVSPELFKKQMRFLKEHRYKVMRLEELAALIREKKRIPPKSLAITFDDGYKDNYTYAFPVLKEYGFPATFFIIVNEVGRAQDDRLSWQELYDMRDSGIISIGSHCLGPEPLVNIKSEEVIRREIFNSKKTLEEKLGLEIESFSYPEGLFNPRIKGLVMEAGYKLAVATKSRKNNKIKDNDVFALRRLRISSKDDLFPFWFKLTGCYSYFKDNRK